MSEKINFNKSMKEKELKIMSYYCRNMSKQVMTIEKPIKKGRLTQKYIAKYLEGGSEEHSKEYKNEKDKKEDNKVTSINKTKKQIVIMDD
jgi:hypothetical protein